MILTRLQDLDVSKLVDRNQLVFIDCLSARSFDRNRGLLAEAETSIKDAIAKLQKSGNQPVLLVLDSPEVLLVIGSATAQELNQSALKLRSLVHSTVGICAADSPLIYTATQSPDRHPLPMETETAAFVAQQAHAARVVMSVRELDTGAARDLSGVLRVTRGGSACHLDGGGQDEVKGIEALYLVQRDGNAKVFERGAEDG